MARAFNLFGVRFGRLVAVQRNGSYSDGSAAWRCFCECGNEIIARADRLKNGTVISCGCSGYGLWKVIGRRRALDKKPWSKTPTYRSWINMISRCSGSNKHAYKYYKGRGITVCERWLESFENFISDMGERPANLSLDRIDNNGNYSQDNCRWATKAQQMTNRREYQPRRSLCQ